jgi:hypothetical protein
MHLDQFTPLDSNLLFVSMTSRAKIKLEWLRNHLPWSNLGHSTPTLILLMLIIMVLSLETMYSKWMKIMNCYSRAVFRCYKVEIVG